jgi:hypothetical protein
VRQPDYLRCHRLSAGDEFPCLAAHLYQIYGNASTLVGYFTRPDGSLHEITRVKSLQQPAGFGGILIPSAAAGSQRTRRQHNESAESRCSTRPWPTATHP